MRYYVEKEEEGEGLSEGHSRHLHIETEEKGEGSDRKENISFRSEHEKSYEDKSVQDSREKRSLNKSRSRISKGLLNPIMKDQEVQV